MNEDIKKMANLLRIGHTMLNRACPICNNPIFRNSNGVIFCPVCNREVIIVDEESNQNNDEMVKQKVDTISDKNKKSDKTQKKRYIIDTTEVLLQKIDLINQKLKPEIQIDMIDKYSNVLLKLFKILKEISSIE